jgi:hypothetical protein
MKKPTPFYCCPARQTMAPIPRAEAARLLRRHRARRTVIRMRSGHLYCAVATQWTNWSLDTRPR